MTSRISRAVGLLLHSHNGPARIVFEAWTKADLFKRWWVPKSVGMTLLSCEIDARVGGTYRLVFSHPASEQPMAFFGRYIEVTPHSRLVWTNEEAGEAWIGEWILFFGVRAVDDGVWETRCKTPTKIERGILPFFVPICGRRFIRGLHATFKLRGPHRFGVFVSRTVEATQQVARCCQKRLN